MSSGQPFYAVVEFHDGLQIIPFSWLNSDMTKAFWPNFTNIKSYEKAVKNMEPSKDAWVQHDIKKIWATSNVYEKARKQLVDAETISDLNSDSESLERLKKTRKLRAKKEINSDDDESCEEDFSSIAAFPKIPNVEKGPSIKKHKLEVVSNMILDGNKKLKFDPKKKIIIHEKDTEVIDNPIHIESSDEVRSKNINAYNVDHLSHNINTNKDLQDLILRRLVNIDVKIDSMQEMLNLRLERMEYSLHNPREVIKTINNVHIEKDIPIDTMDKLRQFEKRLKEDEEYRSAFCTYLSRLGNDKLQSSIFSIMKKLLSNTVAINFSWHGKRKEALQNLEIGKIVLETMWNRFPNTTEAQILTPLKSWLAHATERQNKSNEKMKANEDQGIQEKEMTDY